MKPTSHKLIKSLALLALLALNACAEPLLSDNTDYSYGQYSATNYHNRSIINNSSFNF